MAVSINSIIKSSSIKKRLGIPELVDPSKNKFAKPVKEGFVQHIKRSECLFILFIEVCSSVLYYYTTVNIELKVMSGQLTSVTSESEKKITLFSR